MSGEARGEPASSILKARWAALAETLQGRRASPFAGRLPLVLQVGAIVAFVVVSVASAWRQGLTFDEGAHVPAAYTYVAWDDYRLNPEHPPLVKLLVGAALMGASPRADRRDPSWNEGAQWQFGHLFLFEWNDADAVVRRGRLVIIALTVLLGALVSWWARALFGSWAGVTALLLVLFHPDVLAHGQLVTTDVAAAVFVLAAAFGGWLAMRRLSVGTVLLAGLGAGLAAGSKMSGLLALPMMAAVTLAHLISGRATVLVPWPFGRHERCVTSRRGVALCGAAVLLGAVVLTVVTLWACYGWRYAVAPGGQFKVSLPLDALSTSSPTAASVFGLMREAHLLPEGYLWGLDMLLGSFEGRPVFLAGRVLPAGSWEYLLGCLGLKWPLGFLLMVVLATATLRRRQARLADEGAVLLAAAVYLAASLFSKASLGVRHLLPLVPFAAVLAGGLVGAGAGRVRAWLPAAGVALACWSVLSTVLVYPSFLTYCNGLTGSRGHGYRYLVDSNLDWGQGLPELARWQRDHAGVRVYLSYFGTDTPEYRGIRARYFASYPPRRHDEELDLDSVPSGSVLAVSATNLQMLYLGRRNDTRLAELMARLRARRPAEVVAGSILLYRVP